MAVLLVGRISFSQLQINPIRSRSAILKFHKESKLRTPVSAWLGASPSYKDSLGGDGTLSRPSEASPKGCLDKGPIPALFMVKRVKRIHATLPFGGCSPTNSAIEPTFEAARYTEIVQTPADGASLEIDSRA